MNEIWSFFDRHKGAEYLIVSEGRLKNVYDKGEELTDETMEKYGPKTLVCSRPAIVENSI